MAKADRRTRFEARIQIERSMLSAVNAKLGHLEPLAGMTLPALLSWKGRISQKCDAEFVNDIYKILTECSIRAELLADNSKDVFEKSLVRKSSQFEVILEMLNERLAHR
ncbi:hypothetical protein RUR49_14480 [Pseudoxanthobacter sp. M-2]|uniref:hypothetical protein n=1 Tax=Pseudoxanthobacter sp. M-2 TaxID=3078754 RepID=UPI0038FCAA75